MNILLVAATRQEIAPTVALSEPMAAPSELPEACQFAGHRLHILVTGVGMVATACHTAAALRATRYDLAVNAGVAGAFNRALPPGTVVQVIEDHVAEFGAEDGDSFLSVFDLGLADPDGWPYSRGKLVNPMEVEGFPGNLSVLAGIPKVTGITSNTVRGSEPGISRIRRVAPADVETMEGAAFFHACLLERQPCLQIRAISNFVTVRDRSSWKMEEAIHNLNQVISTLLRNPGAE